MPDHTPGPWRYDPTDTGTAGEWGPAVVHDGEGSPYIAEILSEHREADALLIAAAPDLLAALRWCMDTLAELGIGYVPGDAAIAKAEGSGSTDTAASSVNQDEEGP